MLDFGRLAKDKSFWKLESYKISPNNEYIAYVVDTSGDEIGSIYIKNLKTMELLPEVIKGSSNMLEWMNDELLFYVTKEAPFNLLNLYRHKIATDFQEDKLMKKVEEGKSISLFKSDDKSLSVIIASRDEQTVEYLEQENSLGDFKTLISPQKRAIIFTKTGNKIIQKLDKKNGFVDLVIYSINNFKEKKVLLSYNPDTALKNFGLTTDYCLTWEQRDGSTFLRALDLKTKESKFINFPEEAYNIWNANNSEFDANSKTFNFTYSSMKTPQCLYNFDMETGKLKKYQQIEIANYDQDLYQVEKIFAPSHDGRKIPISLIYKKDSFKKDGTNPIFLRAYGAYGYSQDPWFKTRIFSLVDRGFVYAIAHVRGGKEMGEIWHQEGRKLNKMNSFKDYISSAEFLIKENYAAKDKIVAFGRSAGGMLVSVAMNMRPDLFAVALPEVPACDEINWLSGVKGYFNKDEFGNPANENEFNYMKKWDSYQNIKQQDYPHILISGGWNDPRVAYWQPLKLVAKLREKRTNNKDLIMKMEMESGHAGKNGNRNDYESWAFKYAFILKSLGYDL